MTKRLIVIHTGECGETNTASKGILRTLLGRRIPVRRIVDCDSFEEMLSVFARCGAARGLPSTDGVHYEHAGYAAQTPQQWADAYSSDELALSARLTAQDALTCDIPPVRVTGNGVRYGKGFCGHIDVTNAYGVKGGHWDPGPSFPWQHYLFMVALQMLAQAGGAPVHQDPATVDWAGVRRLAAASTLQAISGLGSLDGSSAPGWGVGAVQNALNLVMDEPHIPVTGNYDAPTIGAVLRWQAQLEKMYPGKDTDFPGAFHDGTRFFTCLALRNIADGKT